MDSEPFYQFLTPENIDEWAKRLADLAQKGALLGDCGKMCNDCAFKYNQPHDTDYLESVDGAALMLAFEGKFHCHTDEHKDAGRPCVGFLYAKQFMNSID